MLDLFLYGYPIGMIATGVVIALLHDENDFNGIGFYMRIAAVVYTIVAWPHFWLYMLCKPCRRFRPW